MATASGPAAHADTTGDPYRLRPDVRVLQAAGDLHRLITGQPAEDASAEFERDHWRIVHRGVVVGTLPEFPEFEDLERLLSRWAVTLGLRESLTVAAARSRGIAHPRAAQHAAIADRLARLEATAAADYADRLWSAAGASPSCCASPRTRWCCSACRPSTKWEAPTASRRARWRWSQPARRSSPAPA
jgi:hypothetical protein